MSTLLFKPCSPPKKAKMPELTTHQINPSTNTHLLTALHHLQRLIQQHLPRQCIIHNLNHPIRQWKPPPRTVLLHANPAPKRQLQHNAPAQRIADVVVPEAQVALLVLQAHQQHFFHQRQLRLLLALRALADVARVEGDFVPVGAGLVGGFGVTGFLVVAAGDWGGDAAAFVVVVGVAGGVACACAAAAGEAGGHVVRMCGMFSGKGLGSSVGDLPGCGVCCGGGLSEGVCW